MDQSIESQPAGLFDENDVLIIDLPCKRCAYNLRGLNEHGVCPECGTPIGLSTRGDLLRFADPDWVEKVARGLKIIAWMILIGTGLALVFAFGRPATSLLVWYAVVLLMLLIGFYGVWLMTEPDPSGIGDDPNITARRVIRITLVIGLVSHIVEMGLESGGQASPVVLLGVITVVGKTIGLIGEFAKFVYFERLAARIPDLPLAKRARFLKWAYTVTLGVPLVGGWVISVAALGGGTGGILLHLIILPFVVAALIVGIMTIFLLFRLMRAVGEQARLARKSWAADQAYHAPVPHPVPKDGVGD